jgi:hypothetical protein
MASGSGAYGVHAGYSQSAGGYYITTGDITANFLKYTGGSGSGGATTVGSFAPYSASAPAGENFSTLINASGKLIRDMGARVVSAGRTFRKFQAVNPTAALSTGGVVGAANNGAGYITGYIEVGSPYALGPNGMTVPTIARFQ